jgi:hypothetical protein
MLEPIAGRVGGIVRLNEFVNGRFDNFSVAHLSSLVVSQAVLLKLLFGSIEQTLQFVELAVHATNDCLIHV